MTAAIRTEQLTKFYGRSRGVVEVDLEVDEGEIFGFLGPNGAGKTTTINLLVDLLRPTSGRAEVLGLDTVRDSVGIRDRIGFLPSDVTLYPRLTGAQLLTYLGNLRGGVDPADVADLASRFDAQLDRPIRQLSTGNRQKLALIAAFMHGPELLILDEPTLGLDPLVQQEFQRLLNELRRQGRTVFLSSHTLSEVERLADRVAIIREGRIVEVASVASLKHRAVRRLRFDFVRPVKADLFEGIREVREAKGAGRSVELVVEGIVDTVIKLAAQYEVVSVVSQEAELEEVFLAYYRPDDDQEDRPDADRGRADRDRGHDDDEDAGDG